MQTAAAQEQELVANLAAGRVVICVGKDAIFVAAVENKVEPDTQPPIIVPLSGKRVAVLLGAAEWLDPASGERPLRLSQELPKLLGAVAGGPRLQQEQDNDIENLGIALLEPLRTIARKLHRRMDLSENEPLVEILLIGYVENYGPDVWHLKYRISQEPLRGDYWQTRVLRPSYEQLYPPEKGQPRTVIEVVYPPPTEDAPVGVLALIQQGDSRAQGYGSGDEKVAKALESLNKGESHKASLNDLAPILRSALNAASTPQQRQVIGVISERGGFNWVLSPPEPVQKAEEGADKARPAGAPSLRKPPTKPPQ